MSVRVKVTLAWWFRWLYMPGAEMLKRALTVKIEMILGVIHGITFSASESRVLMEQQP